MPRSKISKRKVFGSSARIGTVLAASFFLLASALFGSFAGVASAAKAKTPFRVLNISAQSGGFAAYGQADKAALEAAATYLNGHGGILGHKVVIDTVNDNSDPATAVSVLQEYLSNHPAPNDVYAGSESTETQALFPLLGQHNLLSLVGSSGFEQLETGQYPDIFSPLGPSTTALTSLVNYLQKQGYKSVGLLVEGLQFTSAELAPLQADLTQVGITSTVANFDPTALDLTSEESQLQSASPDALVVLAISASAGYALTARAELNWNVPVIGDVAFGDTNLVSLVPAADLQNVKAVIYGSSTYYPPSKLPHGIATLEKYIKPYSNSTISSLPIVTIGRSWDGLMAIAAAAKQANSIKTSAIANALRHFKDTTNPLFAVFPEIGWAGANHENVLTSIADYPVVPAGAIVNGLVKPAS